MKTVVFDVGNVLLDWDPKRPYHKHFSSDKQIDDFFEEIGFYKWNIAFDAGKDWNEGVAELIALHPHLEMEIRLFADNWHDTVAGAIEHSVDVFESLLANGEQVYGITNFATKRWAECCERYGFLNNFTDVVVSGHEKVVKPDPRIYQTLIERNGLQASDCVFVDDSKKNIEAAEALGFATVHFLPGTRLARELSAMGVTGLDNLVCT